MKIMSFLGLSVMVSLSLAGCSNDELVERTFTGNYTLNATVQDLQDNSRASLSDDYKFRWTEDDKIGLLGDKVGNVELSQNSTGNSSYGQFSGNVPQEGVPIVAYFPYESGVTFTKTSEITPKAKFSINLPKEITADLKAPMCGDVENNKVSFRHLCALLKVTICDIPSGEAKLVLTSTDKPLAGKANVDFVDGSYVLKMDGTSTERSITYTFTATENETKTFLFTVPEETYSKLTVSLQKANGEVITEKVLTGVVFTAECVNVTPLFSAKAAQQVSNLEEVSAKFADSPNVRVAGTVDTGSGEAKINIPESDLPLNLIFENPPVANSSNPIKIEGAAASLLTLAVPAASASGTTAADYTINTKAEITCAAAVENQSRGTTDDIYYNYGKITVTGVKEITIAPNTNVEILEIDAFTTVRIYGYVKEVVPKKTADEITIINSGGKIGNIRDIVQWNKNKEYQVSGSRSVSGSQRGYISEWDGTILEPELSEDGSTYEIYDACELAWFQNKTSLSTTAGNIESTIKKNVELYVDIDLKNKPWKGMVLGSNCIFDGGMCTISNLTIKEFILNEQNIYTPNACLGLFGAAMQGSAIKNLTLEGVTITAAAKWAGALVGLSYGAVSYEYCTAKKVNITANDFYSYRVGGLIGFIAAINDKDVTISYCSTDNVNINASYALGGLIGTIQGEQEINISKSTVNHVSLAMSNSFANWLQSSGWNDNNGKPADYIGYMGGFIGDPGMKGQLIMSDCNVSDVHLLNGHFDLYKNDANKAFLGGSDYLGRVDYPGTTINLNGVSQNAGSHYNKFED